MVGNLPRLRRCGRRSRRAFFYACTAHYNRGETVCPHLMLWPMEELDREIMATLCTDYFQTSIAERLVATARCRFEASMRSDHRAVAQKELTAIERKLEHLYDAIAFSSTPVPALMERARDAESIRQRLSDELVTTRRTAPVWADVERQVRKTLTTWRARFSGSIAEARAGLRKVLTAPIMFTPCVVNGHHAIRFKVRLGLEGVFERTVLVTGGTSPTGFEPVF